MDSADNAGLADRMASVILRESALLSQCKKHSGKSGATKLAVSRSVISCSYPLNSVGLVWQVINEQARDEQIIFNRIYRRQHSILYILLR